MKRGVLITTILLSLVLIMSLGVDSALEEPLNGEPMLCSVWDEGGGIYVRGRCTDTTEAGPYYDYCVSGNRAVYEYACNASDLCEKTSILCPVGYKDCDNGACVPDSCSGRNSYCDGLDAIECTRLSNFCISTIPNGEESLCRPKSCYTFNDNQGNCIQVGCDWACTDIADCPLNYFCLNDVCVAPAAARIVLNLTFDVVSGATVLPDSSRNENYGTNHGASCGGPEGVDGPPGKGYACYFDGDDDYIDVADAGALAFEGATESFSVSAWIRSSADAPTIGEMVIVGKKDESDDGWRLIRAYDDRIWASIDDVDVTSDILTWDNTWYHIVFVADRTGNGQIYVNGVPSGSAVDISGNAMDITANLRIGFPGEVAWNGIIDEVVIWNYALTGAEVQALTGDGGNGAPGVCTGDIEKNIYVYGEVSVGDVTWKDECINSTTLNETYCSNNQLAYDDTIFCSNGCVDGACIAPAGGLFCPENNGTESPIAGLSRASQTNRQEGDDEILYYCGLDLDWHKAKPRYAEDCGTDIDCTTNDGSVTTSPAECVANYECISNSCADGLCFSVREELSAQRNFIYKIWCMVSNMISFIRGEYGVFVEDGEGYCGCLADLEANEDVDRC